MSPASEDDILIETRDRPADADACAAEWAATIVRLGLQEAYGVRTAPLRLPANARGQRFRAFGVYIRRHDGVAPDEATRTALRAAIRVNALPPRPDVGAVRSAVVGLRGEAVG
jgi:hypothetical protein